VVWRTDASKVIYSPDGRMLATVNRGSTVQLWDSATMAVLAKLEIEEESGGPGFGGAPVVFSGDSRILAIVSPEDVIRLWDARGGKLIGTCTGHKQGVKSIALSPEGKTLVSSSDDGTLKFWNVATQQELLSIRQLGATLDGLLFSPDGQMLVGGSGVYSQAGGLRFFRASTMAEADSIRVQAGAGRP
jgi:WD40 repeat protein